MLHSADLSRRSRAGTRQSATGIVPEGTLRAIRRINRIRTELNKGDLPRSRRERLSKSLRMSQDPRRSTRRRERAEAVLAGAALAARRT